MEEREISPVVYALMPKWRMRWKPKLVRTETSSTQSIARQVRFGNALGLQGTGTL
jgi:hypothetical protein